LSTPSLASLATGLQGTFLPDVVVPARGQLALYSISGNTPDADALADASQQPWRARTARLVLPGSPASARDVPVAAVSLADALPGLLAPTSGERQDSLRAWEQAARLALTLVAGRQLLPSLRRTDEMVVGQWSVPTEHDGAADAFARLAAAFPRSAHALEVDQGRVWRPEALLAAFLDAVGDLAVRCGGPPPRSGRPRARLLPWTARWAEGLADPEDPSVPLREDAGERVAAIAAWEGNQATSEVPDGSVEVHLSAPETGDGPWCLDLGVRTGTGRWLGAAEIWEGAGDDGPTGFQQTLLRGLAGAARLFPPLDAALRDAAPRALELDVDQAWDLLNGIADRLVGAGIGVVLPSGLAASDLVLRLRVGVETEPEAAEEASTDEQPSPVLDAQLSMEPDWEEPDPAPPQTGTSLGALQGVLTGYRWEVAMGGEPLTQEEFAELVAAQRPLVRFREQWVRVDPGRVRRLAHLRPPGQMGLAEALALGLAGSERVPSTDGEGTDPGETAEVVLEGGLADLAERIREARERPLIPATPPGFVGELRPYQRRGVAWLQAMGELGLGAVLADDMGLGKGVSLVAYLLQMGSDGASLVVCPTSVVGNWQRELARFAPSLNVVRHHGPERALDLAGIAGVVLTSYGTLRRDVDILAAVPWDLVALDEAQQVKNPTTAGARAVRRLRSRQTVALTGTPLENRLTELWSLLDATNRGLLGSRAAFGRRFVTPIEQQGDAPTARRLRRLVGPFVLRREKRDPTIAADLPEKIERVVACSLTPEQAALYQAAVDRTLGTHDAAFGPTSAIARRGRILALLTELKQICNHPAQYLRERAGGGHDPLVLLGRSGKLATARQIVAEAVDGGAQLLCFTQYVEMGHLLVEQFSADLGVAIPFLYGAVPATRRDQLVAAFQGEPEAFQELDLAGPPPVLVVSLRAGGTGLNLTAASHVLHYDRWWNPAVEDQATDRAHRIGQTTTVEVHKLMTAGTVEERIADLLERKRELAQTVVGAGEAWITELGDDDLAELVALSSDAPIGETEEDLDWLRAG